MKSVLAREAAWRPAGESSSTTLGQVGGRKFAKAYSYKLGLGFG